jgi:coenzyme F420-reducing hydrogenase alpha subunit
VCLQFTVRLAGFLRADVFAEGKLLQEFSEITLDPMGFLSLEEDALILRDRDGKEMDHFPAEQTLDKIGLVREPWSYEPFAYVKEKGWQGLSPGHSESLYFVGPLARLNTGRPMATPLAEEERLRMLESLGPVPHFGVVAAYWSLSVELLQAAEGMKELCVQEKLTGPAIRAIPTAVGREGYAALESSQGFIFHRYRVNDRGLVERTQVLDVAKENNAARCRLAAKAVEVATARTKSLQEMKRRIEISLLPF